MKVIDTEVEERELRTGMIHVGAYNRFPKIIKLALERNNKADAAMDKFFAQYGDSYARLIAEKNPGALNEFLHLDEARNAAGRHMTHVLNLISDADYECSCKSPVMGDICPSCKARAEIKRIEEEREE